MNEKKNRRQQFKNRLSLLLFRFSTTRNSLPEIIFSNNIKSLLPFSVPPSLPLHLVSLSQLLLYTVCQKIIHSQVFFFLLISRRRTKGNLISHGRDSLIYSRSEPKLIFDENYCHFVSINIIRVEVLSEQKRQEKNQFYIFFFFSLRSDRIVKLLRIFFIHS